MTDDEITQLEAEYDAAREAFEAADRDRFPNGDRDELKDAADRAFKAWDYARWVKVHEDAGYTIADDGRTVIEGPKEVLHEDETV